jgi:hypothetical protein
VARIDGSRHFADYRDAIDAALVVAIPVDAEPNHTNTVAERHETRVLPFLPKLRRDTS